MIHPVIDLLIKAQKQQKIFECDLSEKTGYHVMNFWRWKNGKHNPGLMHIENWANFLGFTLMLIPKDKVDAVNRVVNTEHETTSSRPTVVTA